MTVVMPDAIINSLTGTACQRAFEHKQISAEHFYRTLEWRKLWNALKLLQQRILRIQLRQVDAASARHLASQLARLPVQ